MSTVHPKKQAYRVRLEGYLDTYKNALIVGIDNVGSKQMQQIRIALRGKAVVLMGKNTMIRKIMRDYAVQNPKLESLIPLVIGNVGLVFTNDDLGEIRKVIVEYKQPAAAKTGAIAPVDVFVPPGPTGLDPGQTSFFQALNIMTKIVRGSIEIMNEVHLIPLGEKVTSSHVALLAKLNICPFFYGVQVKTVYEDGEVYNAAALDITDEDMQAKFFQALSVIASVGLGAGYPCTATVPHQLANGFQKLIAISLATEFTFEYSQKFKDYLANPDAFKTAATEEAPKEEEKKVEEESESSSGGGMGMFGSGSDSD